MHIFGIKKIVLLGNKYQKNNKYFKLFFRRHFRSQRESLISLVSGIICSQDHTKTLSQ